MPQTVTLVGQRHELRDINQLGSVRGARWHVLVLALVVGLLPAVGFAQTGAQVGDTERWLPLSTTGNPGARREHSSVWTGREMLVVGGTSCGGRCGPGPNPPPGWQQGGRYNPLTDTWRSMAVPPRTGIQAAVWDHGMAYDPAADRWRQLPQENAPAPRISIDLPIPSIWSGSQWIVWGGLSATTLETLDDGAAYVPPAELPPPPGPEQTK